MKPIAEPQSLEFIYTPLFERMRRPLLDDEAMRRVENRLLVDPRAGDLVAATGGVRKLRLSLPGRGRRGGARLVYLYVELHSRIYFLLVYAKNERVELTPGDKKMLRDLVNQLEGGK